MDDIMRQRIMNWVWDGRPTHKPRWLTHAITRITCAVWGHQPAPDLCGWCLTDCRTGARR